MDPRSGLCLLSSRVYTLSEVTAKLDNFSDLGVSIHLGQSRKTTGMAEQTAEMFKAADLTE